jgi:aminoglycoside phosphotransferase (APT) family kinase protein
MEFWYRSEEREFLGGNGKVSKRQLRASEVSFDFSNLMLGDERLTNESETLRFIKENTTIPVPDVLSLERDINGSLVLVTELIDGKTLSELDDGQVPIAIKAVDEQMERHIMPELHKLRRHSIGSVKPGLPLMPPAPIMSWTRSVQKDWKVITSEHPTFVFCHTDLSRGNIILNPETYKIVAVIDWEYAGYGPEWFERKLWRSEPWTRTREEEEAFIEVGRVFLTGGEPK